MPGLFDIDTHPDRSYTYSILEKTGQNNHVHGWKLCTNGRRRKP
jgi:hypothetical protein